MDVTGARSEGRVEEAGDEDRRGVEADEEAALGPGDDEEDPDGLERKEARRPWEGRCDGDGDRREDERQA